MEQHTFDKEKMDSVRFLAETNMKIGEARSILIKLQETETEYLESREKKAIERIQKVLDESKDLLAQTKGNYEEIHSFYVTICSFSEFLQEAYEKFQSMQETFNEHGLAWDAETKRQHEEISEIRKIITEDKIRIKNDTESITKKKELIKNEERKIESRQAQIKSALEVLNKKQNG